MMTADAASQPPTRSVGVDSWHLVCARCAYQLGGLSADGDCPECGLAVSYSAGGAPLASRPLRYLRALCAGLGLVLMGGVLLLVVGLYGQSLWLLRWLVPLGSVPYFVAYHMNWPVTMLAGLGTFALGLYLLASPDRPIEARPRPSRWRVLLRVSSVGLPLTGAVWWVVWQAPRPVYQTPALMYFTIPPGLFLLAALAAIVSSMLRMRRIGERHGSRKLARLSSILARWIPIGSIGGFFLGLFLIWYFSWSIMSSANSAMAGYIPFLPALLGGLTYLALVVCFRVQLGRLLRTVAAGEPGRAPRPAPPIDPPE